MAAPALVAAVAPAAHRRRPLPGSPTGWVAVGLGAVGVGVLAARAAGHHLPACALQTHAGVACPVCGITRLADHLVHGRLQAAAGADAFGVVLLVVLAVVAGTQLRAAATGRSGAAWLRGAVLPVGLVTLALARWALVLTGATPLP